MSAGPDTDPRAPDNDALSQLGFVPVELRHLQTFISVFESGGFRRAADSQHTAQPALTRHIQQLEHELGVQLFRRSATGASCRT